MAEEYQDYRGLYGDPTAPDWGGKNLTTITTPGGQSFVVNKEAAPAFLGFLAALEARGYPVSSSGGYNVRNITGGTTLSPHAYGVAVDVNAANNPYSRATLTTDLPPDVGRLAGQYGLVWGGSWQTPRDPMHFEYRAMTPKDFVGTYGPLAQDVANATGLDPKTVLGQIAVETGWGRHMSGNNPFGISPGGKVASYGSISEGAQAYVDLINRKYQVASTGQTPASQASIMVQGGYNTADPDYAAKVAKTAERVGQLQAQAQGQTGTPSADDLLARVRQLPSGQQQTPPAPEEAPAPSADDLLARVRQVAPPPAATQAPAAPAETTARGVARNVAAGVLEGSGAVINVLHDPVGNLVLRPLTTLGAGAYDWLAPHLGLPQLTPEQRADLTGDTPEYQQPGTRLAQAAGAADVTPATPTEALVRQGVAGAVAMPLLAPSGAGVVVPAAIGAGGAIAGGLAASAAPAWAAPSAAVLGNVAGGAFSGLAAAGALRGGNALARGISAAASGPVMEHPLAPRDPQTGQPIVPAGPPTPMPQPAGAQATPPARAAILPGEAAAYRSTAEIQKLTEPQPVGVPDARQLVPNEDPTLVQIEQNAGMSRELKALRNINPQVAQLEREVADRQNTARANYYQQVAKSDIDLLQAQTNREANGEINAAIAWRNKGEADITPVTEFADQVLKGPDSKRDVIVKQIGAVRDKLFDRDGKPETDPEMLYGVRKDINDRLSKEAAREDPMSQRAAGLLIQMRNVLDQQIEAAAPGFKHYLEQWHADSKPIDAMSVLQKWEPRLFDSKGKLLYSKFNQMLREAVISRRRDMPLNDWQSVTDEQMQQLWDIRDALRRAASADELAAAKGSDTAPNAMDIMRQYMKLGGMTAAHGVANLVSPGWGSMVVSGVQHALSPLLSARAGRQQLRRGGELLSSPPPTNPLTPP